MKLFKTIDTSDLIPIIIIAGTIAVITFVIGNMFGVDSTFERLIPLIDCDVFEAFTDHNRIPDENKRWSPICGLGIERLIELGVLD